MMHSVISKPTAGFAQALHKNGNNAIYLLQWTERGDEFDQPVHYVLEVPSAKQRRFERIAGKESFALGDFGAVLDWGYGHLGDAEKEALMNRYAPS